MATSPKPFTQRRVSTAFLRVPSGDWAAVRRGFKSEFRATGRGYPSFSSLEVPTPVVAYMTRTGHDHEGQLMVLERWWREPLGAISPESLQREGFESMAHFRRYWMGRTHKRFSPLTMVHVYRVRPFTIHDREPLAMALFDRLYAGWAPR